MSMRDDPFVSVVLATYRRPLYLARCIQHLSAQADPAHPFELVVVTDGPDKPSTDWLGKFVPPAGLSLKSFSLPEKRGPAAARNAGWRAALGDLIIFTDDDCIPAEGWVAQYVRFYSLIQAHIPLVAFTGKVVVPLGETPTDYEKNIAQLETAEFITANCACSRLALEAVGGFDEQFAMAWREDSALHFALLQRGIPIYPVPSAVVTHPVRPARWGVSLKEQKKSMFDPLLYRNFPKLFRQKIRKSPLWNYYAMALWLLAGVALIFNGYWQLSVLAGLIWLLLVLRFAIKRLHRTRKTAGHIAEMIFTSAVIPLLSLFWRAYGSIKFKRFLW